MQQTTALILTLFPCATR